MLARVYMYTAEEKQRGAAIRFSADRRSGEEVLRGRSSAQSVGKKALLSWEEDITLHPEQKGTKRA